MARKPDADLAAMVDRLEDNIRAHGWDAAVDAASTALRWATGDLADSAPLDRMMDRPEPERRDDWIRRGGNPDDW